MMARKLSLQTRFNRFRSATKRLSKKIGQKRLNIQVRRLQKKYRIPNLIEDLTRRPGWRH